MGDVHQTADIGDVCERFTDLHQQVARFWGRVEVTSQSGEPCVLISKAELESIERALEIMCDLPGNESFCKELTEIAERCRATGDHIVPAQGSMDKLLANLQGATTA